MNVKGSHVFDVSQKQLWDYLMNPEVLAKITPGVTNLETLGADSYKSISDIKIGPVKGSFKGKLKVVEKNEPASFTIKMEQLSKIGNAHATVLMNLADKGAGKAELNFDGKAKLSGVIARTGQRVLSGVANTLTKEVFASLEQHIEEEKQNKSTISSSATKTIDTQVETSPITEMNTPTSPPKPIPIETTKEEVATGLWASIINFFKQLFGQK